MLGNYAKAEMEPLSDVLAAIAAEAEWLADGDDARFMSEVALRLQQALAAVGAPSNGRAAALAASSICLKARIVAQSRRGPGQPDWSASDSASGECRLEQLKRFFLVVEEWRASATPNCSACTYCRDRAATRDRSIRARVRS